MAIPISATETVRRFSELLNAVRYRHDSFTIRRSLARFFIPIYILLYSADEVEQWHDSRNHVIAHALQEGRVVYERN